MTPQSFVQVAEGLVSCIRQMLDSLEPLHGESLVVEDLRSLLGALHLTLERYGKAIASETDVRRS